MEAAGAEAPGAAAGAAVVGVAAGEARAGEELAGVGADPHWWGQVLVWALPLPAGVLAGAGVGDNLPGAGAILVCVLVKSGQAGVGVWCR
jgi:hypothetical protein